MGRWPLQAALPSAAVHVRCLLCHTRPELSLADSRELLWRHDGPLQAPKGCLRVTVTNCVIGETGGPEAPALGGVRGSTARSHSQIWSRTREASGAASGSRGDQPCPELQPTRPRARLTLGLRMSSTGGISPLPRPNLPRSPRAHLQCPPLSSLTGASLSLPDHRLRRKGDLPGGLYGNLPAHLLLLLP